MVDKNYIDEIRLNYRLSKSAEGARIVIDQKLVSFARVYLTAWTPDGEELDREKARKQAERVIKTIRKGSIPKAADAELCGIMEPMVLGMEPARMIFDEESKERRKEVVEAVRLLPACDNINIVGFGPWGLGVLIGEFGDITDNIMPAEDRKPGNSYSGVRRIYKRLGLAPDECYPRGEKSTGRMTPRKTRGRIIGIIAESLFKHQWAAERGPNGEKLTKEDEKGQPGNIPAHPTGPYGVVHGEAKARHLTAGKKKGHAHNLARRAMIKALIHDVHRAWHGLPPDYVFTGDEASHEAFESQIRHDRPSPTPEVRA